MISYSCTFLTTTVPAPINARFPILMLGKIVEFAPIIAYSSIVGPIRLVFTSIDLGYFAFVKTTLGPIQQFRLRIEYSGIKQLE